MTGKWMCFLVQEKDIVDNKLSYAVGVKPDEKTKGKTIEIYANKDNAKTFTVEFFDYLRYYDLPATADTSAEEYKKKIHDITVEAYKAFEAWLKEEKTGVENNVHDLYGDKTHVLMNFVQHPLIFKMDQKENKIIVYTRIGFDSFSVEEIENASKT